MDIAGTLISFPLTAAQREYGLYGHYQSDGILLLSPGGIPAPGICDGRRA